MRSRTSLASAVACGVLLAACGGIPPSSAPMQAAPAADEPARHVTGTRSGPEAGATPTEIIEGFVAAMEFYEAPHGYPTAMEFLTEEAASDWRPLSEIVIYSGRPEIAVDGDAATVTVRVEATYDRSDGFVRHLPDNEEQSFTFGLTRVEREWRMAEAPAGLLIAGSAFANDFEAYNLYFYNKAFDSQTMVPEVVYVPRASSQETLLLQELLKGPSRRMGRAAETAFPQGTELEPDSVPVTAGDARVTLSAAALTRDSGGATSLQDRDRMVEQIVRTLGGTRTVDRVSVSVTGGATLSGTEENSYVSVEDPVGPSRADPLYVVTGTGLAFTDSTASDGVTAVAGPLGSRSDLQEVAVDRGPRRRAAAVTEDDELVLADLSAGSDVTPLYPAGGAFGSPVWDGDGLLWVIERPRTPDDESAEGEPDGDGTGDDESGDDGTGEGEGAGDSAESGGESDEEGDAAAADSAEEESKGDESNRLLVIDPSTGDFAAVTPATPDGAEIERVAVSPDGTRLALVVGGRAYEAIVVRDPERPMDPNSLEVRGMRELHVEFGNQPIGDVAWSGPDELALLTAPEPPGGEPEQATVAPDPRVQIVPLGELQVDTTQTRAIELGTSVAAPISANRIAVGTDDGVVWIRSSTGRWSPLDGATAPAFAG